MSYPNQILYPACEPYEHGWLSVSPLHHIYYEQCGNPNGQPVVVLHGGPGSGCNAGQRRFFDPAHYRIILFDQRGCNRSQPLGSVEENTTWNLVDDLEQLRLHLGIARWLVFGGSWGSTLALAYAATHPQPLSGLILRGIFLCRARELEWFLRQVRQFFPEAWETLVAPLVAEEYEDIFGAYWRRIFSDDPQEALAAAVNWNAYESSIMSLLPSVASGSPPEAALSIARARVQLHYLVNLGFLAERPLLEQVHRFQHIPATIIQGRYDMVCPPVSAHELHQAWPQAQFQIIPDAGHSAMEPGIAAALVAATNAFREPISERSQ
jgi:proline iminopeptidase